MNLGRPEYVSDLIVYLLNGLGVEYIPLNPGATIRGIHESVVSYGGNQSPELITCCHEELAIAMAQGYYLAIGRKFMGKIPKGRRTPTDRPPEKFQGAYFYM